MFLRSGNAIKSNYVYACFWQKSQILGFLLIFGCHALTPSRNWKVYQFFAPRAGSGVKMYGKSENWYENP